MTHAEWEILHNIWLHVIITLLATYNFAIFAWWWWQQRRATTIYGLTCFLMFGMIFGHAGAVWLYIAKYTAGDMDLSKYVPNSWTFRHYLMIVPMVAYAWYATKKIIIDHQIVTILKELCLSNQNEEVDKTMTILVADDSPEIRNLIKLVLTRTKFLVIEARDGKEAFELFQKNANNINCVILDLLMPKMDGWEALTMIRSISPNMPAIMTSGYLEDYFTSKKHKSNFCEFLHKPYSIKTLLDTIDKCIVGKYDDRR